MVALRNRRNNQTNVPEEIQEYYQTERRERAGVAWMLAIGTLLVTILLTAGIFFAGRWAWREIAGNDEPETAQNEDQKEGAEQQSPQEAAQDTPAESSNDDQPAEENEPAEDQAAQNNDQSADDSEDTAQQPAEDHESEDQEEQGHTSSASTTNDSSTSSQQVAGKSTSVPETGPGDTIAIFFAVSIIGYLAHRYWNRVTQ